MNPDCKDNKFSFFYDFKKKEEEIKSIINPLKENKKNSIETIARLNKNKGIFDNLSDEKLNLISNVSRNNFKRNNKKSKNDEDLIKNEDNHDSIYFNEPEKKYIILNPKNKINKDMGYKNVEKVCKLELNLDLNSKPKNKHIDLNSNDLDFFRTNEEFQGFMNSFQMFDIKYAQNVRKKYDSVKRKKRINTANKNNIDKGEILKMNTSLFKNEKIKFLNNI